MSPWTFQVGLNVTVDETWVDVTSRHHKKKRGKLAVNLTLLNSTFYWHFNIPAFYLLEQILGKCVILTYYMCGILINTVQINNTYYICFLLIIFAFLKISNKFYLMECSEISLFTKLLAKPTRHYVVPI